MGHNILELDKIPRERQLLQSTINTARRQQKIRNLQLFALANLIWWIFYVSFIWQPVPRASTFIANPRNNIYITTATKL